MTTTKKAKEASPHVAATILAALIVSPRTKELVQREPGESAADAYVRVALVLAGKL